MKNHRGNNLGFLLSYSVLKWGHCFHDTKIIINIGLHINAIILSFLEASIKQNRTSKRFDSICCADYGAADGVNSIPIIRACLSKTYFNGSTLCYFLFSALKPPLLVVTQCLS